MYVDTPLSLSPLSPLPARPVDEPTEVLPEWLPAQRVARRHAMAPLPSIAPLRNGGFLSRARAERIAEWYADPPAGDAHAVAAAYAVLADEATALARAVTAPRAEGGLGVRVTLVTEPDEPYAHATELCSELRRRRTMTLRAASADPRHPLLADAVVDGLRIVHDVLGHAALGLGFDLQSEYAAWLYCRPLFSPTARPAAFCELVGAVTAHVLTGTKPVLRAALAPAGL
jgi:hypothetical protein